MKDLVKDTQQVIHRDEKGLDFLVIKMFQLQPIIEIFINLDADRPQPHRFYKTNILLHSKKYSSPYEFNVIDKYLYYKN